MSTQRSEAASSCRNPVKSINQYMIAGDSVWRRANRRVKLWQFFLLYYPRARSSSTISSGTDAPATSPAVTCRAWRLCGRLRNCNGRARNAWRSLPSWFRVAFALLLTRRRWRGDELRPFRPAISRSGVSSHPSVRASMSCAIRLDAERGAAFARSPWSSSALRSVASTSGFCFGSMPRRRSSSILAARSRATSSAISLPPRP